MNKLLHFSTNVTKTAFILFVMLFITQQKALAQDCPFALSVTSIVGVDCLENGQISLDIIGTDGQAIEDSLKMFIKLEPGQIPEEHEDKWVTSKNFVGLEPGTYLMGGRVFCGGVKWTTPQYVYNVVVPRIADYNQPSFIVKENRKSLNCKATGEAAFTFTIGKKGPFKLELLEAPATYIDPSELPKVVYNAQTLTKDYTIDGLAPGFYSYKLTDGCGGVASGEVTIGAMATDFYSTPFYTSLQPGNYINADYNSCSSFVTYARFPTSSEELYAYAGTPNARNYYEYAVVYEGEAASALPSTRWKSFPTGTSRFVEDMPYDLVYVRGNVANRQPKMAVRIKDTDCIIIQQVYINTPSFSTTTREISCGVQSFSFSMSTYSAMICYPYTWEIQDYTTGAVKYSSTEPVKTYSASQLISPIDAGRYKIVVTDSQNQQFIYTSFTITNTVYQFDYFVTSKTGDSCAESDSIQVYMGQGSYGATLKGATIEFDAATTNPLLPVPKWTRIEVPKDYTGSYIYPYGDNWNSSTNGYRYWTDFPPSGTAASRYVYFNVTDSCGNTYSRPLYNYTTTYLYRHVDPQISAVVSCGKGTVKFGNNYPMQRSTNGAAYTNFASYAQVTKKPTGAEVIYSTPNSLQYLRGGYDDEIYLSKSGTYEITVSRANSFTSASYCLQTYEITVDIPEFGMDKNLTAAYRCPNNSTLGYMQVTAINGSGNYKYELYTKADQVNPIETSTNGIFDSWAGATSSDTLVVRVTDIDCGAEFMQDVGVYDLDNQTMCWTNGSPRKCMGDDLRLYALPLANLASYEWTFPDLTTTTEQNPVIGPAQLKHSGIYKLKVTVQGCVGYYVERELYISVADHLMYWSPLAADNNWHNANNWLLDNNGTITKSKSIPAPCTTVHIAGNSLNYPNLDSNHTPRVSGRVNLGEPACDTIIYHYGSETVHPHYLSYNRAKVQYNFNYYDGLFIVDLPPFAQKDADYPNDDPSNPSIEEIPYMLRSRWYMISSPLKHITGGDFGLAGYPFLYQRLYNAYNPENRYASHDSYTNEFSTLNQNLEVSGHAMALLAAEYETGKGWDDHKNLEALQGVIELPYFLSEDASLHAKHLHTYNSAESKSTFQYFNSSTLVPMNKYDTYVRDYKGYRFVFENDNDTVSIETDKSGAKVAMYRLPLPEILGSKTMRFMVGNPLMCHLDFDKVYAYNNDVIKDNYWYNDPSSESFVSYRVWPDETYDGTITNEIAPLQGFLVEVLPDGTRTRDYLLLPLEGAHSVVSVQGSGSQPKPRTSLEVQSDGDGRKGWIEVIGVTPPSIISDKFTSDSIRISSRLSFNYEMKDIPKLVFPQGLENKLETFFINNEGYLTSDQVENDRPTKVSFGVESKYAGKEGYLNFRVGGNIVKSAILYDKVTGGRQDVTTGGTYRFNHRYDRTEQTLKGLDTERFEIHFVYETGTGIDSHSSDVSVSVNKNRELIVLSGETLDIVELVNVSGVTLDYAQDINATEYRRHLSVPVGTYLVKVKLKNGESFVRKIVIS